ncbi:hypothetical protein K469DRAFT_689780 [Zopfia rhizophila CBS 207.26]|uniref:Uncharacterized protein n=1 Tax=Zopfia rhizophila CBS 207.26 TaxID=1314779 RepID=A0A6A6DXY5_9PEZI|nr:hypothetical protein K469DRAFT_689780 [Zopfia rhizophila CBS 207.26]
MLWVPNAVVGGPCCGGYPMLWVPVWWVQQRGVPITAWCTHHSMGYPPQRMGYPPQHGPPTTALGTHNMGHPPRHGVPTAEEEDSHDRQDSFNSERILAVGGMKTDTWRPQGLSHALLHAQVIRTCSRLGLSANDNTITGVLRLT